MRKLLFTFSFVLAAFAATAQTANQQWDEGTAYHTSGEIFHGLVSWASPMKGQTQMAVRSFSKMIASRMYTLSLLKFKRFNIGQEPLQEAWDLAQQKHILHRLRP